MKRPSSGNQKKTHELMKVAMGEAEADLAVINGKVLNVYTGEVLSGNAILVKGNKIAYVGENAVKSIGSSTKVIDANGKVSIPGFIDSHTHLDTPYSLSELSRYAIKSGTTTVISEISNLGFPFGYQGISQFLKSTKNQLIKIYSTIPPMVTLSRIAEENAITVKELRKLLKRKDVVGLGESFWAPIVAGNQRVDELMEETINAGKVVEGHSSGAKDNKLQAYITSGVTSCHEPITAEEVKERLRLGLYILIREGEIRRDLEAISKIKEDNIDLSRLVLSTDGLGPWQLTTSGYMDFVVQKAIDLGFGPITAIKMATINPAQHFKLDNFIGGIAPGKCADILIIPDLHTIKADTVISDGRLTVSNGNLLLEPESHVYPKWMEGSIKLKRDFTVDDFRIPIDTNQQTVKIRVMDLITGLLTKESMVDIVVSKGNLCIDTTADLLKIAAIERTHIPGKTFVGIIKGFEMKSGAVASSAVWDLTDIIVVGANEVDMAHAVNRIRQLKGGIVVCNESKILAEVPLPIGGFISKEPIETISSQLDSIQEAASSLGFPYPDLRTTLAVMATPAIPFLRICEDGLFSVDRNSYVELIVD